MRANGYLAFFIGLCATVGLCLLVMHEQDRQIAAAFQRDADKVARDTDGRLQVYFDMLLGVKGMLATGARADREQLGAYLRALELKRRYPGFRAILFLRAVDDTGLEAYAETVRQDQRVSLAGYPRFEVHPAGVRKEHYVAEFVEPMQGNETAFGIDLGQMSVSGLQTFARGRDTGAVVATEPIRLIQDGDNDPAAVAIRAAVYRNGMPLDTAPRRRAALDGFISITMRIEELMREVVDAAVFDDLSMRIVDAGCMQEHAASPDRAGDCLLYDSAARAVRPAAPVLRTDVVLEVGQRRWDMAFSGYAGRRYGRDSGIVAPIALAGLTISALIAALIETARRRRLLAERLTGDIAVRRRTEAALVETKHGLEHSLAELARQKANADAAHAELSAVLATLKETRNTLITSEKMASLGALVAGIAHELNTPIGNSLLTATTLHDMVQDFESKVVDGAVRRSVLQAHLAETKQACQILAGSLARAADLIVSFKQVAVDQTSDQRRRFDLAGVLRDTLTTFSAQLRRAQCEVGLEVAPELQFDSYPGSVAQVLSNLLTNALLHGFEGRGAGRIEIAAAAVDGERVRLVFRDNGVGMSARTLHQVFDPFFTTKLGQGGSGLGMHIVYNIVTGMLGGSIEIASEPGQGTAITMLLPRRVAHGGPA